MEKTLEVCRLIFFVLFGYFLGIPFVYAQRDTVVVYDTIFEVKDPVVIRHEYYSMPEKLINRIRLCKIYCGAGYSLDSYKDKKVERGDSKFASIGGSIWLSKVFFAELGFNYQVGNAKIHSSKISRYPQETTNIEYDTIGSYVHTVDGVSTVVPVVDEIVHIRTDTVEELEPIQYNKQISMISIPFSAGYIYARERFYCALLAQVAPVFLSMSIDGDRKENREKQLRLGAGIEFGFKLTNAFAVSARYTWLSHIQNKVSYKDLGGHQHQVSLLLNYFF